MQSRWLCAARMPHCWFGRVLLQAQHTITPAVTAAAPFALTAAAAVAAGAGFFTPLPYTPQIVRLEGTNVEAGKEILKTSGIDVIAADDLDDAATKAVASIK